jgi:methionyl-tRNA formyltransferase
MKIAVICTEPTHPVMPWLRRWQSEHQAFGHAVSLLGDRAQAEEGDILFLVSCGQIIGADIRARFRAVLVLHASDLPSGRGWSPHIWSILGGANTITVCLLEASEKVDRGAIWARKKFMLEGHELLPEINAKLFQVELDLMSEAVRDFGRITPQEQSAGLGEPMLRKRTPEDSRIDPHRTIAEQFELLRVVDSDRYPAFMELRGHRYLIKLEKVEEQNHE